MAKRGPMNTTASRKKFNLVDATDRAVPTKAMQEFGRSLLAAIKKLQNSERSMDFLDLKKYVNSVCDTVEAIHAYDMKKFFKKAIENGIIVTPLKQEFEVMGESVESRNQDYGRITIPGFKEKDTPHATISSPFVRVTKSKLKTGKERKTKKGVKRLTRAKRTGAKRVTTTKRVTGAKTQVRKTKLVKNPLREKISAMKAKPKSNEKTLNKHKRERTPKGKSSSERKTKKSFTNHGARR